MIVRTVLLTILTCAGVLFSISFYRAVRAQARTATHASERGSFLKLLAVGFVTVFFDTLGIGCFATTTSAFRAWSLVPDELIPGTLNVGHAIAAVLSAIIFIVLVPVEPVTLVSMIAAAGLGAWVGAGWVAGLPRFGIRLGMGTALLLAATFLLLTQFGALPAGGLAQGLSGFRLMLAVGGNFVLGALMTLGIGLYAPCMILIAALGMDPHTAFPIMMGSCAFLMSLAGLRFLREARYHGLASIGLTIGGVPALLIAAFLVKQLPLTALRWLVVAVVLYTAGTLLHSGLRELRALRLTGSRRVVSVE